MSKNELLPHPAVNIRHCPKHLWLNAAAMAEYGRNNYSKWPGSTCPITDGSGNRWYWKCTSSGNITVEYLGRAEGYDEQ